MVLHTVFPKFVDFYRPQAKLQEGNVFTVVWLATGVGGGYLWSHVLSGGCWVSLVPGPFKRVGMSLVPPQAWHLGVGMSGGMHTHLHSRKSDTTGYGRQAGSVHLTGMLSC